MNEIQRLHERAMAIVKRFKKCEIELIEILQEVGAKRVFYTLKFSSLFDYAVRGLGLSEEMAYIYIGVSRKAAEVPALAHEIRAGRVSVSKAKTICSVITRENQSHWLDLAKSSTKRQLEREVAIASPRNAVREKATYQSAPTEEQAKILQLAEVFVELKLGVPEALMLKLRQAQDLVSQGKRRHATLVETFEEMVD